MSAYPCEILNGPITIRWGNLAVGGYPVIYPARTLLDVPPGSLLEAQIGTGNIRRLTDAERAAGAHADHSALAN
jgi:hypothetical protein